MNAPCSISSFFFSVFQFFLLSNGNTRAAGRKRMLKCVVIQLKLCFVTLSSNVYVYLQRIYYKMTFTRKRKLIYKTVYCSWAWYDFCKPNVWVILENFNIVHFVPEVMGQLHFVFMFLLWLRGISCAPSFTRSAPKYPWTVMSVFVFNVKTLKTLLFL